VSTTGPAASFSSSKYLVEQFQAALNQLVSMIPGSGKRPVGLRKAGEVFEIQVDGRTLWAPGPRRWRMYRKGIDARLEQVGRRYGLHDVYPSGKGQWVVDIGGYMGEWSLLMLRRGFNVLVIEPDPNAAFCLNKNLQAHAPTGSTWLHEPRVALNEKKTVQFYAEPINADGSIFPSDKHRSRAISIEADRLDQIVAERIGDQVVRAFKMDAEGAEPEVLQGATKVLERCERIGIDAGAERMGEATVADCRKILAAAGFTFLEGHAESDMVVVARKATSRA